ncbi:PQQ-binding-like beta-propeller repeat protein [Cohnella sp. GCM10020058]|uniref:outer membrane protein assembly factor BamB family protein n=1 Tax=Cohnella sp. GCM10020058 TaxID=3317330 RepID=UPI0036394D56
MKRKILGLFAALFLLVSVSGLQGAAAAAKVQLLPSNDYKELPYINDNGKKVQLRGYKNFEVDWSVAEKDAWPVMLNVDRLLLLNGDYTKAISTSGGRKLWEQHYFDSDLLSVDAWGQSSNGTIFTLRKDIVDDTFDARVDLLTRDGKVKSTYHLPHDDFIFPDFISASGLDSNDNLITTISGGLVSVAPNGAVNWVNDDFVDWTISSSSSGSYVFTTHKTNIEELIVDAQNNVLVLTDLNHVYYVNSSGKLLWDVALDSTPKDWKASGYIQKTGQWVRAFGNPTARMEILDLKSGKLTKVTKPTAAQLDLILPKAGNGRYYVEANRGIAQIDTTGKTIWEYPLRFNGYYTVMSLLSDSKGNVYIQDNGGSVFSLDPAGKERYVLVVKNMGSISEILVDGNGTLYVVDTEMGVLAIKQKKVK